MDNQVKCPKCGSQQISANKKGFSGTKAVVGAVVAGPIGLVAGTHGSGNVNITCLNCGNVFKPGIAKSNQQVKLSFSEGLIVMIVGLCAFAILLWILF